MSRFRDMLSRKWEFGVFLALPFAWVSCGENHPNKSTSAANIKRMYEVKVCNYSVRTIPDFFEAMVTAHYNELKIIDSTQYLEFCKSENLDFENAKNEKVFYTIKLMHNFFTCENATNGSRGRIINIPYYWHWVTPNPRYEIISIETRKKLNQISPPKEFSKYQSFADIDRTPYLFLSDLFSQRPKYYSSMADTFSTFGWCSEREMAFVCLLELLGFKGNVISEDNHSWSEFIVPFTRKDKGQINYKLRVDNTFNQMNWTKMDNAQIIKWNNYQGNLTQANWYNIQAHSEKEKRLIKEFQISPLVVKRIEGLLVDYLDKKINIQDSN